MTCQTFRVWSEQLMKGQPVLDRLPAARGHVEACRQCREGLERRLRVESWEADRRGYWSRHRRGEARSPLLAPPTRRSSSSAAPAPRVLIED
jgi:hypothetical protein